MVVLLAGGAAMWWSLSGRLDDQQADLDVAVDRLDLNSDTLNQLRASGGFQGGTPQETVPVSPNSPTGPVPATGEGWVEVPGAAESRAAITDAYLTVFALETPDEQRNEYLSVDGETDFLVDQIRSSACAEGSYPVVTSIEFTDPDRASVRFAFQGPAIDALGFQRSMEITGSAVRRPEANWIVTTESLRATNDTIAANCPG